MNDVNHAVVVVPGTGDAQEEMMCYELAKVVGEYLHHTFPGYLWRVNADIRGGIVNIFCGDVSMEKGCTIPCAALVNAGEAEKMIKQAGGEILERAKLHRGRMREHELMEAKRDLRGDIIGLD